jgi:hypothetical protein
MENYRSLIARQILTVRRLILEARYYKYDRAEWEEDYSEGRLFLAEANLKDAESMLKYL